MIGKSPDRTQKDLFQPLLIEFINMRHELVLLGEKINLGSLENEFSPFYSSTGTPAKPIRLMCGLLVLKQLNDLGDETLMPVWVSNSYFQHFCGEAHFQHKFPCDPSDLVHFRKHIGEKGIEDYSAKASRFMAKMPSRMRPAWIQRLRKRTLLFLQM